MKLSERAIGTPHLWIYFDIFSILSLDLINKPQNAKKHAIDVRCILIPTGATNPAIEKRGGKEVMFQVKDIIACPLSSIPNGEGMFEPTPGRSYPGQFLVNNIFLNDGALPIGNNRAFEISRALQPYLVDGVREFLPKGWLPIVRFGIRQVIPLDKTVLVK